MKNKQEIIKKSPSENIGLKNIIDKIKNIMDVINS